MASKIIKIDRQNIIKRQERTQSKRLTIQIKKIKIIIDNFPLKRDQRPQKLTFF